MAGLTWPPAHVDALRALAETMGADTAGILRAFAETHPQYRRAQVEPRLARVRDEIRQRESGAGEWTARRDAAAAEVQPVSRVSALVDAFRPVDLPPIERPRVKARPNPCYVVSSDHHWPLADPRVEAILLQTIEALRPRGYILNGDGPDLLALSRYPKDARRGHAWPLADEQRAAKSWWRTVAQAGAGWDMALYETEANHSGNDRESRWRRWLNENCPVLFGLDGFEEDLSYARYFHPADAGVQLVPEVVLAGDLRVRHGEVVRKHGGYSARAHGDKWQSSVMHGHTHRIGSSIKRRPGIPGVRPDEFLRTYETGCVCRLDADYAPGADWAQGFAIVTVDDATQSYGVELVQVVNGRAAINALGATLAA